MKILRRIPIKRDKDTIIKDTIQINSSFTLNETLISDVERFTHSVRVLSYVEPYLYQGKEYTLFYTEVDHNYVFGDKVFIEGGFYDSDTFIENNKYSKGVDGYNVLYVDRCKVVLDIPYSGIKPSNEEPIDNFIKVYVANNQYEFDYYSQTLTMKGDSIIESRFEMGMNNFLFINCEAHISGDSYNLIGFSNENNSDVVDTLSYKFLVRHNNYFLDITDSVLNNNITHLINSDYNNENSKFYCNLKMYIMNSEFEFNGIVFRKDRVYQMPNWSLDKTYLPTIITENHFRDGIFSSGVINQGLIGQHEKRISYDGSEIKWNMGSLLNVEWLNGIMESNHIDVESYFTVFDRLNKPQIRSNSPNNGGSGYNYVFNSNFIKGDIINGNIFNLSVRYGTYSNSYNIVNEYLDGNKDTTDYSVKLTGGVYYNSDIYNANISNSTIMNSNVYNSYVSNSKSVNSQFEKVVFENSQWLSDSVIKIQHYEESNINWYDENNDIVEYKMYKFYLNQTDWLRLREFNNFYIQDLFINNNMTELLNLFDDKLSFTHFYKTKDVYNSKDVNRCFIQISSASDNYNSVGVVTDLYNQLVSNDIYMPSIDIFISNAPDFNIKKSNTYPRRKLGNNINISDSFILNSDFVSGLFKDSTWVSGNYINYNKNHAIKSEIGIIGSYNRSNNSLLLNTQPNYLAKRILDKDDIVFVNGLWYKFKINGQGSNLYKPIKMSDVYVIKDIINNTYDLSSKKPMDIGVNNFSNSINIFTPNAKNRYNYLHPLKFENSIIKSGIFKSAYFENCIISNDTFNSQDKDLSNYRNNRSLLLSDIIFDGDNNTINNALVQYSSFVSGSDKWLNGIFHRSVWNTEQFEYKENGETKLTQYNSFLNGVFRNSNFENGVFENGVFYLNRVELPPSNTIVNNTLQLDEFYNYDNGAGSENRWSFRNGEFRNGEFRNSNFEDGLFINGLFTDSDFLSGTATGGVFGEKNVFSSFTRVWSGEFSNIIVENADFISNNYIEPINKKTHIIWHSGVFNNGNFGTKINNIYNPNDTDNNTSTWHYGDFNGGVFGDTSKWLNGKFNGGVFNSYHGVDINNLLLPIQYKQLSKDKYAWENGEFNGGVFGSNKLDLNSTWYSGEFNGGLFKGRYWNNGIFTNGEFKGSATYSTIKEYTSEFFNSFRTHYYGLWNNGIVSNNKDRYNKDENIIIKPRDKNKLEVKLHNMLWMDGIFSNYDAKMYNSLFIKGKFEDGIFEKSAFNPYISYIGNIDLSLIANQEYRINNLLGDGNELFTLLFDKVSTDVDLGFTFVSENDSYIELDGMSDLVLVPNTSVSFNNLRLYKNNSAFRDFNEIKWINGEAIESDFYKVEWDNGIFKSNSESLQGNMYGVIWKNGICEYSNAYNTLWLNGNWINGNWYGSPFKETDISPFKKSIKLRLNYVHFDENSNFNYFEIRIGSDIVRFVNTYEYNLYEGQIIEYLYDGLVEHGYNIISIDDKSLIINDIDNMDIEFDINLVNNDNFLIVNDEIIDINGISNLNIIAKGNPIIKTDFNSEIINGVNEFLPIDIKNKIHVNNIIDAYKSEYLKSINNSLFDINILNYDIRNHIELPNVNYDYNIDNVYINYGNGHFLSGVWEFGVWNQGYRLDDTLIKSSNFDKLNGGKNMAIRQKKNIWFITLLIKNESLSTLSQYKVGDKVSIGNIVAKDINDKRRLLRDFGVVESIELDKFRITIKMYINFTCRTIEIDSDLHDIYISKNIWLNGILIHGYFDKGIWNNGLISGYPYITAMEDVHWIDGSFKGGRFISTKSEDNVHSAVIQKFNFSDENMSLNPYEFKHNSWIDVVYDESVGVNINRNNSIYRQNMLGFTASFIENDYYGYPTYDVLESVSRIRNGYNNEYRTYRLGSKYNEYTNFLVNREFNDINEIEYSNTTSPTPIGYGVENMIRQGWTFSTLLKENGFAETITRIVSNIGDVETEQLHISGGRNYPADIPFDDNKNFSLTYLDNINTHDIEKLRYSFVEAEFVDRSVISNTPILFYNNFPSTYSIASRTILFNNNDITIPNNQLNYEGKRKEYFYNKNGLELSIFSGPTYSVSIKTIRFVETDMIPFPQYTSDCINFIRMVTWDTFPMVYYPGEDIRHFSDPPKGSQGTWESAMSIGTISDFGVEGNLDVVSYYKEPTWDNLYMVNDGVGCISYINQDIIPIKYAISPDLMKNIDGNIYLTTEINLDLNTKLNYIPI